MPLPQEPAALAALIQDAAGQKHRPPPDLTRRFSPQVGILLGRVWMYALISRALPD